jgi:hypothetical protein
VVETVVALPVGLALLVRLTLVTVPLVAVPVVRLVVTVVLVLSF